MLGALASILAARKVLAAHRNEPVRTGYEEMIGTIAEVRTTLDPEGQVFVQGALWHGAPRATAGAGQRQGIESGSSRSTA